MNEKNPLITVLVGPPGSGKSTWTEGYLKAHNHREDLVYVNQDLQGREGHMAIFNEALSNKNDIVIDRMNFSKEQRDRYLDPAKMMNYSSRIVVFHISRENCLTRCNNRKDHPTIKDEETATKAVGFFFRRYDRVLDHDADEVMRMGWVDKDAVQCVYSDIDGTLANVDHRLHHVRPTAEPIGPNHRLMDIVQQETPLKKNWKAFFDGMVDDTVNPWCRAILDNMSETYPIVYATGRPEDYKEITDMWLRENRLTYPGYSLFTRMEKDNRRDDVVKEIILDFEIKTKYNILFAIDDRQQVVDMLRRRGVTVLQCANGDF